LRTDYEARRFSPEVELALRAENRSDRKVRAYEGSLDVHDLLGNEIISLTVEEQTPLDIHQLQHFKRYWEINEFLTNQSRFAATDFENLRFDWKPEKILFADGATVEANR
jgi:hypothetical protein